MNEEEKGICAIVPRGQQGYKPRVFGMGILVGDRLVMTCAHVVGFAVGLLPGESPGGDYVRVCFPFVDGNPCVEGTVEKWYPANARGAGGLADIAIIRLGEDAPGGIGRSALHLETRPNDLPVRCFGFGVSKIEQDGSWESHPTGEWPTGKVIATLPEGRAQLDGFPITGAHIQKGFSGAGVFDRQQDAVVGMIVKADKDPAKRIAQFITVPILRKALAGVVGVDRRWSLPASVARPRAIAPESIAAAGEKLREVESYLRQIGDILPRVQPGQELPDLLKSLVEDRSPQGGDVRIALGLPRDSERACQTHSFVLSADMESMPFVRLLIQRVYHILWRFEATLHEHVRADWKADALSRVRSLIALCKPSVAWRPPRLKEMAAALDFNGDLSNFAEAAPDPTLYAALRALSFESDDTGDAAEKTLAFVHEYLVDLLANTIQIQDSSNAWWATSIGLDRDPARFRLLLPDIAGKYDDVILRGDEVRLRAAVPEIYVPLRTASYTLSNIQHIFELEDVMDQTWAPRLHRILMSMVRLLLDTQRDSQLYLASVHHEGLRNFLDYVADQGLGDVGASRPAEVADGPQKGPTQT